MTQRSKFNKYARKAAEAGKPLGPSEILAMVRRQHRDPPSGKRHKHRLDLASRPVKAKRSGSLKGKF